MKNAETGFRWSETVTRFSYLYTKDWDATETSKVRGFEMQAKAKTTFQS